MEYVAESMMGEFLLNLRSENPELQILDVEGIGFRHECCLAYRQDQNHGLPLT